MQYERLSNRLLGLLGLVTKSGCTHKVRTHAVLLLSVSPPSECEHLNPKTVPLLGYPIPYTKFEHFGIIRFYVRQLC